MTNRDDQAFPMSAGPLLTEDGFTNPIHREEPGLSKREYFAARAMQGFLASPIFWEESFCLHGGKFDWKHISQASIGMADALIDEMNREPKP